MGNDKGDKDRVTGVDGRGPSWLAKPNLQVGGCILFAAEAGAARKAPTGQAAKPRRRGGKKLRAPQPRARALWRDGKFPVMPRAMVAAGKTLFVSGPLDRADPADPWASLEGRSGGVLCVLDAGSGKKLAEHTLPAPPVWNGMAAANRRLYISTQNGKLLCYEAK